MTGCDVLLCCLCFSLYLQADLVDIAYHPIFQSGGEYNFSPSAISNDDPVDYGVIVCQAGARYVEGSVLVTLVLVLDDMTNIQILTCFFIKICSYASYCANVGRTYFINPTSDQEKAYNAVVGAQAAAIAALVDGADVSRAYEAAFESLKVKP